MNSDSIDNYSHAVPTITAVHHASMGEKPKESPMRVTKRGKDRMLFNSSSVPALSAGTYGPDGKLSR